VATGGTAALRRDRRVALGVDLMPFHSLEVDANSCSWFNGARQWTVVVVKKRHARSYRLTNVDKYSDSLLAGIRSGKVILIDLELALAMQKEDIWSVLERYRPLVVQPPDAKPVIGVLQQRHDFPREVYEPERRDVTPETSKAELYSFIEDATIISGLAVQYYQDGTPTIVLVDPAVAEIREKLPEDAQPEGRWGLLAGGEHNVMRFDAFAGGVPLSRWLLFNPSESVVRAGASGAHTVMLLSERPNEDQQEAERQWRDGVPVWVPHVEVFRALLRNF